MNLNTGIPRYIEHDPFDQLMDLYEQNYILIRRLLGDLRRLDVGDEFSLDFRVTAHVTERGRFTLELTFTDHAVLDSRQRPVVLPVRIYLDARAAELHDPRHPAACLQSDRTECNRARQSRNRMLQKWLLARLRHE
ncbi:MAG: DUF1249 domain-containing protein [Pseudomonadota bacterium]